MLQQSKRQQDAQCSERPQRATREVGQNGLPSRSADESLFHMAGRIPEGTERNRRAENADAERGTGVRIGTASRGSNRVVARSNQ